MRPGRVWRSFRAEYWKRARGLEFSGTTRVAIWTPLGTQGRTWATTLGSKCHLGGHRFVTFLTLVFLIYFHGFSIGFGIDLGMVFHVFLKHVAVQLIFARWEFYLSKTCVFQESIGLSNVASGIQNGAIWDPKVMPKET